MNTNAVTTYIFLFVNNLCFFKDRVQIQNQYRCLVPHRTTNRRWMVNYCVNNIFFCFECLSLPFSQRASLTTRSLLTRKISFYWFISSLFGTFLWRSTFCFSLPFTLVKLLFLYAVVLVSIGVAVTNHSQPTKEFE